MTNAEEQRFRDLEKQLRLWIEVGGAGMCTTGNPQTCLCYGCAFVRFAKDWLVRQTRTVTITRKVYYNEYRVPAPSGKEEEAYYTDDRQDALDTAKHMWREYRKVVFRIRDRY